MIVMFLIVITPLYALGAEMNSWGASIVKRVTDKSLQSMVRFYQTSLENEIDRIERLQREYVNDEDLAALAITPEALTEFQTTTAIIRLQERLKLMKESSQYIENVSAHIPGIGKTVSTEELVSDLSGEQLDILKQAAAGPRNSRFYYDGKHVLLREYYPNKFFSDGRNPMFVLELTLSAQALMLYLEQLTEYEGGGAALLHADWQYVSTGDEEAFSSLSRGALQAIKREQGLAPQGTALLSGRGTVQERHFFTMTSYVESLGISLFVFIPEKAVLGPLERYRIYMWCITGAALIIVSFFSFYLYRAVHRPLTLLVRSFRKVESGNLSVSISYKSNDEFHYLYEQFNHMVSHLNKLIYEVYEQKIHLQRSELKQLQSQINPHFLYNSFYLLYRMTKAYDCENAMNFTKYLGDYFQYVTRSGSEEVQLIQEFQHVRAYAEIQAIRFSNRMTHEIRDPLPELAALRVPRLILQPIVENAYNHGFSTPAQGLRLTVYTEPAEQEQGSQMAAIVVEDNGVGMPLSELERWERLFAGTETPGDTTGMLNVHLRLRLKYGKLAGISLSFRDGGGLRVRLLFPVHEEL
jgi:two-component system sensor histidine kinase YesM